MKIFSDEKNMVIQKICDEHFIDEHIFHNQNLLMKPIFNVIHKKLWLKLICNEKTYLIQQMVTKRDHDKTQIVRKLKNSNFDETKKSKDCEAKDF